MSSVQTSKLPVWFWVIAAAALLWNLMGVVAYIMQMTMSDETIATLPKNEQDLYINYPAWAAGAFALAVFGGACGAALLIARNKFAVPIFGLSLAGIAIQMFHSFVIANSIAVYGPGALLMPLMVVIIGVGLFVWSMKLKGKGWIN